MPNSQGDPCTQNSSNEPVTFVQTICLHWKVTGCVCHVAVCAVKLIRLIGMVYVSQSVVRVNVRIWLILNPQQGAGTPLQFSQFGPAKTDMMEVLRQKFPALGAGGTSH